MNVQISLRTLRKMVVVLLLVAVIGLITSTVLLSKVEVWKGRQIRRPLRVQPARSGPRILCWVLTTANNLETKAAAVNNTWGRRCDRLLFISPIMSASLPTVVLRVPEGRSHLTAKSMAALKYCHTHFINDYDWFFKADDDTYVIMDNARHYLSKLNSSKPLLAGFMFTLSNGESKRKDNSDNFVSGGAGYVLSRAALVKLAAALNTGTVECPVDGPDEDVTVSQCLSKLGVELVDTVDEQGRERFHAFSLWDSLFGRYPHWMHGMALHPPAAGPACCSNTTISFHYIDPNEMYVIEFLLQNIDVIRH